MPISTFETRSRIGIIGSRVSRWKGELPIFSLVHWDENENFPTQSRALRRDWEILSFFPEIRDEIEKLFLWFSAFISIFIKNDTDTLLHDVTWYCVILYSIAWYCIKYYNIIILTEENHFYLLIFQKSRQSTRPSPHSTSPITITIQIPYIWPSQRPTLFCFIPGILWK